MIGTPGTNTYKCPKKVLVALPPGLLEQIDFVAQVEHRTRSDLIRESLRRYIEGFRREQSARAASNLNELFAKKEQELNG